MGTITQLKLSDINIDNKYYINNPSKNLLKKNGFRYDAKCSTEDCECYIYEFPVEFYKKTPVTTCRIRVYMDNGDVTVDVHNSFGLLPAWYQKENPQFAHYKNYLSKINRQIIKRLNIIGVQSK